MEYISFGTGEKPLVILPGMSLKPVTLAADAVAAMYADFTADYTVYLFDVPEELPEDCSIGYMADRTAEKMRELGIENACVLGCSQGGMLALHMAVHHPDLISRLVLASTYSRRPEASPDVLPRWLELALAGDKIALNRSFAQNVYSPAFYAANKAAFDAMENDGTEKELRHLALCVKACIDFDVYDELEKITCPVLVIGAWDDAVLGGECSVELAEKLRCPLYMYNGFGHAVYDEAPDFIARIFDFYRNMEIH